MQLQEIFSHAAMVPSNEPLAISDVHLVIELISQARAVLSLAEQTRTTDTQQAARIKKLKAELKSTQPE